MSKNETHITRWYWEQVGGILVEEFPAVKGTATQGRRPIDGIIIRGKEKKIVHWKDARVEGKDIIVVQTKNSRLGMYLMGQAYFSGKLMEAFNPRSIKSVALCTAYDDALGPLLEEMGVEVVIYPGDQK